MGGIIFAIIVFGIGAGVYIGAFWHWKTKGYEQFRTSDEMCVMLINTFFVLMFGSMACCVWPNDIPIISATKIVEPIDLGDGVKVNDERYKILLQTDDDVYWVKTVSKNTYEEECKGKEVVWWCLSPESHNFQQITQP